MAERLLASVSSSAGPQKGQKNRSSGAFSTQDAPRGTTGLIWRIDPHDSSISPDEVTFNVMLDKSAAKDPVVWSGLTNDRKTGYSLGRDYYIANPSFSGSKSSGFNVYVYAEYPD